ncbi:hypothetical protein G6F57_016259 [Rhizopus arrhizus]|nr:hypothetical protein G6F57_016259 [Rhizopus arrhizus]
MRPAMGAMMATTTGQGEGQRHERQRLRRESADRRGRRQREQGPAQQVHGQDRRGVAVLAAHQQPQAGDGAAPLQRDARPGRAVRQFIGPQHEQSQRQRAQQGGDAVETVRGARRLGQAAQGQHRGQDADGHVDPEQPVPGPQPQDGGRRRGAGRKRQADHHRVQAQPAAQHVRGIDEAQQRPVHAHHAGRAQALQDPRHHQRGQRRRQATGKRRHDEHHQPYDVDAPVAQDLAERGRGQQSRHHGQLIAADDPDRPRVAGLQIARDGGQRGVGDGRVQAGHADRQHHGQQRAKAFGTRQAGTSRIDGIAGEREHGASAGEASGRSVRNQED